METSQTPAALAGKVTQLRPPGVPELPAPALLEPQASEALHSLVEALIGSVCNVMGSVSVMEASAPDDVPIGEPQYKLACRAIYGNLDDILTGLNALEGELSCHSRD